MKKKNEEPNTKKLTTEEVIACFNSTIKRHRSNLVAIAYSKLSGTKFMHLAEDAVQTGLLDAYIHFVSHPGFMPENMESWLTKIVINQVYKILKRGKSNLEQITSREEEDTVDIIDPNDPESLYLNAERLAECKDRVQSLLGVLTPHQITLVKKKFLDEKTYVQVAEDTKITEGAAKSQIFAALRLMRSEVTESKSTEEILIG